MAAIEPDVRAFCARSLDPLVGSDGFDVIADLGAQVPMRTIGMLLGIPESDQEALRDKIDDGLKLAEGDEMPTLSEGFTELGQAELFEESIDYRYEHPGDDVMMTSSPPSTPTSTACDAASPGGAGLHQPHRRGGNEPRTA